MEKLHNIKQKWVKGQEILLNPNTHPQLLHHLILNQSLFHHYINPKRLKNLGKPKRATEISQSSGPTTLVTDETIYKEMGDIMERVATTAASLDTEQDSGSGTRCQDTILGDAEAQIRFEAASKQSNDVPLSKVNILRSGEDSMKLKELMEFFNAGVSLLMLPSINLLLPVLVHTDRCIEQFWATAKAKTVNGERQIQALVDKKKVIITEMSVRSDLKFEDAEGTDCLPTATIFEELTRMRYENLTQKLTFYKAYFSFQWKFLIHTILQCLIAKTTAWNEFSSTMASAIICLATNQKFNFSKYIFDNMVKNLEGGVKFLMYPRFVQVFLDKQVGGMSKHKWIYVTTSDTKKVFANMKRPRKGFSDKVTPLFQSMMIQASEDMGEDSVAPTNSHPIPIITQPSSSRPQKKQLRRKQRKDSGPTEPITNEATNEEHILTPSYDPSQSGKDLMQLNELMDLCTKLSNRVLALENTNTSQATKIVKLKERIRKLEKKRMSQNYQPKRLYKGRKIADLDANAEVTLIDETQGRNDEDLMFDTGIFDGEEVFKEPMVNAAPTTSSIPVSVVDPVTTAGEVVTTASDGIPEELTLAQTLIEIKSAKPKAVTTTATTVTPANTRTRAKGIVFHDQEEQAYASTPIVSPAQPSSKDKGKGKMVEPEPEKKIGRKTQIQLDEELALRMHAEEQAELKRMERERVTQEEASRAAVIEEFDSI
ncbi:hypothetical protein Tco_0491208 [Tanacetum coccineum]